MKNLLSPPPHFQQIKFGFAPVLPLPFLTLFRQAALPSFLALFLSFPQKASATEDPSPAAFEALASIDCGELRVAARAKLDCSHQWSLTVGSQTFSASGSAMFSQTLHNINTYALSQASLTHTVDCNGVVTSVTETVSLPLGVFIGQNDAQTFFTAVSPFDGQPLLPGDLLAGKNVYAMGILVLDKNDNPVTFKPAFTFESCNMFMRGCSAIEVRGLAGDVRTLRIAEGSVLYNGEQPPPFGAATSCALWRGIEVRGTGRLVVESSEIRDALFAINLLPNAPNLMPRLTLSNTNFVNNYIGVNMIGSSSLPIVPTITFFSGNVFTNTRELQAICERNAESYYGTYRPTDMPVFNHATGFAGVHARFASFWQQSAILDNTFSNLANGIVIDDSNAGTGSLPLRRCRFLNLPLLPASVYGSAPSGNGIYFIDRNGASNFMYQSGTGTQMPNFVNCEHGVFAHTNVVRSFVLSNNNVMNPVVVGTRLRSFGGSFDFLNGTQPQAGQNQIFASRYGVQYTHAGGTTTRFGIGVPLITLTTSRSIGILVEHIGPPVSGDIHDIDIFVPTIHAELGRSAIELRNTRGVFINGYFGDGSYNEFVSPTGNGIWLSNGYHNRVVFNRVQGSYNVDGGKSHGIRSEWGGDNIIGENDLANTYYGLRFTGLGTADIFCNNMGYNFDGLYYDANAMTGDQELKRNGWIGPFTGLKARHEGLANNLWEASEYKVGPTGSAVFAPSGPLEVQPPQWFTSVFVFPETCLALASKPLGRTDFDVKAATVGFPFPSYTAEQNWTARRFLYGKLKAWPTLVNDTMQAFLDNYASSSLGRLADLAQAEAAALQISPGDTAVWQFNQEAVARRMGQIAAIDSNFMAAVPPPNETQLLAERAQSVGALRAHQTANFLIDSLYQAQLPSLVAAFAAENSAISTTLACDANEKALQGIWLSTAALGEPVSQAQAAAIAAIARDCPEQGGTAVFWARAWYEYLTGEEIERRDTCAQARGDRPSPAQSSKLSAFPNPATESLTVLLPEGLAPATVQLFSPLGRLVAEARPDPGANTAQINLRGLPPGTYLLRAGAETLKIAVARQ
jgi:hypothetical protein